MGDRNKMFTFTVTLSEALPTDYTGPEGATLNADRTEFTFTLKHNGAMTLPNLPMGATVTVVETNADGYLSTHTVLTASETAPVPADSAEARAYRDFSMPETDSTVTFTNTKNITIPTGVDLDYLPYLMILGMGALLLALLAMRKRARQEG